MTAQRLWVSQKGQDVFSHYRGLHTSTLLAKGKQGNKRFSLPSGVQIYISEHHKACHQWHFWRSPLFSPQMTTAFLGFHCRVFLHMVARLCWPQRCQVDSLAGDGQLKASATVLLLHRASCRLRIKYETEGQIKRKGERSRIWAKKGRLHITCLQMMKTRC